jgi:type II secretory pathway pseudopilin PulG
MGKASLRKLSVIGLSKIHDTVGKIPLTSPPPLGEGIKPSPGCPAKSFSDSGGRQGGGKTVSYHGNISIRTRRLPSAAFRTCSGFTYIGLLIAVALVGVLLASTATIWHQAQQRENELQLLFVGKQFGMAIGSYYDSTPGTEKHYPKTLEDLIEDRRTPFVKRHLRKIFYDPISGTTDWGLVKNPEQGIIGIYSKSEVEPLKKENFSKLFSRFAEKKHYSEWKFTMISSTQMAALANQNGGNPVVTPPAEVLPPEYVPPPQQIYANTPEDTNKQNCDNMHSTDLLACWNVAKNFDAESGSVCLASAAKRYTQCINGQPLSPLAMKFKQ